MRTLITEITINGTKSPISEFVNNEFAEAVKAYNFKDDAEVNEVFYALDRCRRQGLYDWCPADTKALKQKLGMEI